MCNTVPVTFGVNTCLVSASKGFRLFGTSCKKYMDTFGNLSSLFSPFKCSISNSINSISTLSVVLIVQMNPIVLKTRLKFPAVILA